MSIEIALTQFQAFITKYHNVYPSGHAFVSRDGKATSEGLMTYLQREKGFSQLPLHDDQKIFVQTLQGQGHPVQLPDSFKLALAICHTATNPAIGHSFYEEVQLPISFKERTALAITHFQETHANSSTPITDELLLEYMCNFGYNLIRNYEAYGQFIQRLNQTGLNLSAMTQLDFAYNAEVRAKLYKIKAPTPRPEIPDDLSRTLLAANIAQAPSPYEKTDKQVLDNTALLASLRMPAVLRQLNKAPEDILAMASHLKKLGHPVDIAALASDPLSIASTLVHAAAENFYFMKDHEATKHTIDSLLRSMGNVICMANTLLKHLENRQYFSKQESELNIDFEWIQPTLREFINDGMLATYDTLTEVFALLRTKSAELGFSCTNDLCTPFQFAWMVEATPVGKLREQMRIPAEVETMALSTDLAKAWLRENELQHISNANFEALADCLHIRPILRHGKGYPSNFRYLRSYEDWCTLAERLSQAGYTVEAPFLDLMDYAVFTEIKTNYLVPKGVCHITLAAKVFSKWINMLKIELTKLNTHDVRKNFIKEALACNTATLKAFMNERQGYRWIKSYKDYCALAAVLKKSGYSNITVSSCSPEEYNKDLAAFDDEVYDQPRMAHGSFANVKPTPTTEEKLPTLRTLCYATLFANASQTDTTGTTELAMAKHAMDPATAPGAHPPLS